MDPREAQDGQATAEADPNSPADPAGSVPADPAGAEPTTPAATPDGTPAAEGASKTDDPEGEARRILTGKYRTEEELLTAISAGATKYAGRAQEMAQFHHGVVRELGRQGAAYGPARREAEQAGEEAEPEAPAATPEDELAELMYADPAEYHRTLRDVMLRIVRDEAPAAARETYAEEHHAQQTNEAVEQRFYADNPDLKGHEKAVRAAAHLLVNDPEIDPQGLSRDEWTTLIAAQAREFAHGDGGPKDPPTPPVSPATPPQQGPAEPQLPKPLDERLFNEWGKHQDELEARLNRRLDLPLPKKPT